MAGFVQIDRDDIMRLLGDDNALRVYLYMFVKADYTSGNTNLSLQNIAGSLSLHKTTVIRSIERLIKNGFISLVGKKNIECVQMSDKKTEQLTKKCVQRCVQVNVYKITNYKGSAYNSVTDSVTDIINNNKLNNNNLTLTRAREKNFSSEFLPIEKIYAEYRADLAGDTDRAEKAERYTGKKRDEIAQYLDKFHAKKVASGEDYATRGDYMRHFISWMMIEIKAEKGKQGQQPQQERDRLHPKPLTGGYHCDF